MIANPVGVKISPRGIPVAGGSSRVRGGAARIHPGGGGGGGKEPRDSVWDAIMASLSAHAANLRFPSAWMAHGFTSLFGLGFDFNAEVSTHSLGDFNERYRDLHDGLVPEELCLSRDNMRPPFRNTIHGETS